MFEFAEKLSFIHDRMNALFADDFCFEHLFHGKQFFTFLKLHAPYFTEAPLSNDV